MGPTTICVVSFFCLGSPLFSSSCSCSALLVQTTFRPRPLTFVIAYANWFDPARHILLQNISRQLQSVLRLPHLVRCSYIVATFQDRARLLSRTASPILAAPGPRTKRGEELCCLLIE